MQEGMNEHSEIFGRKLQLKQYRKSSFRQAGQFILKISLKKQWFKLVLLQSLHICPSTTKRIVSADIKAKISLHQNLNVPKIQFWKIREKLFWNIFAAPRLVTSTDWRELWLVSGVNTITCPTRAHSWFRLRSKSAPNQHVPFARLAP